MNLNVYLEDSIMQKGQPVTAGSKILENFIAPFDAAVVTRLTDNNIEIAGRVKMNEFGIGIVSADSAGEVLEAVKAVACGDTSVALCNDVFGQYRKQAAEQNLCYIRPTYGTVSRFGLISTASSMDQIGVVCKNMDHGFQLLSAIAGNDVNDGAMFPEKVYSYQTSDKKITIGVPHQADENTRIFAKNFNSTDIKLEHFDICKQVMYILSCAEISNNINRYDGIKFGYRTPNYKNLNELYLNTRTEAFGLDTKLAAVMGAMVLSQEQYVPYYEKAMKIRRLIKNSLRFDTYDIIALPTSISDDPYENLSLYALAPLAGLPSVSFSYSGQGIQLIANVKNENSLLTAWEVINA